MSLEELMRILSRWKGETLHAPLPPLASPHGDTESQASVVTSQGRFLTLSSACTQIPNVGPFNPVTRSRLLPVLYVKFYWNPAAPIRVRIICRFLATTGGAVELRQSSTGPTLLTMRSFMGRVCWLLPKAGKQRGLGWVQGGEGMAGVGVADSDWGRHKSYKPGGGLALKTFQLGSLLHSMTLLGPMTWTQPLPFDEASSCLRLSVEGP